MREFPPRFLSFSTVAVSGSDKIRSFRPHSWIKFAREKPRNGPEASLLPVAALESDFSQKERSFVTRSAAFDHPGGRLSASGAGGSWDRRIFTRLNADFTLI